jgi:hypothetical protein
MDLSKDESRLQITAAVARRAVAPIRGADHENGGRAREGDALNQWQGPAIFRTSRLPSLHILSTDTKAKFFEWCTD